jgi:hypothetical protein
MRTPDPRPLPDLYFYYNPTTPLFLLMVYAKAVREESDDRGEAGGGGIRGAHQARRRWMKRGDGDMNKFSRDLVQGMQEAAAFADGKRTS